MHYDTDPCSECARQRHSLPVRSSEDRGEHPKRGKGRRQVQDLPPRDHDVVEPKTQVNRSGEVVRPLQSPSDLDAMTPDELRAMLAAKREAKRVSQAKWRAKAK